MIWGAISPKITEKNNPMVSRVVTTLVNTNAPLAKWAVANVGKRIAIVSDTSDYGAANLDNFRKFFEADGGSIVAAESAPVGTTDFRALLTKIKAANPDAIYFGGVIAEAGLVRQADGAARHDPAHDRRGRLSTIRNSSRSPALRRAAPSSASPRRSAIRSSTP